VASGSKSLSFTTIRPSPPNRLFKLNTEEEEEEEEEEGPKEQKRSN